MVGNLSKRFVGYVAFNTSALVSYSRSVEGYSNELHVATTCSC